MNWKFCDLNEILLLLLNSIFTYIPVLQTVLILVNFPLSGYLQDKSFLIILSFLFCFKKVFFNCETTGRSYQDYYWIRTMDDLHKKSGVCCNFLDLSKIRKIVISLWRFFVFNIIFCYILMALCVPILVWW